MRELYVLTDYILVWKRLKWLVGICCVHIYMYIRYPHITYMSQQHVLCSIPYITYVYIKRLYMQNVCMYALNRIEEEQTSWCFATTTKQHLAKKNNAVKLIYGSLSLSEYIHTIFIKRSKIERLWERRIMH